MEPDAGSLFEDLKGYVSAHGIKVKTREMDVDKPGEFDGPSVTINPVHNREALGYYLTHSFGSIFQWSTDFERAKKAFDDLRDAKKGADDALFEEALEAWRLFEQTSSDHAIWVLGDIRHAEAIQPYTTFFRADIEAMTLFHRTGKEPRWPDFFADWKRKVASGEIRVEPFRPKPVVRFRPVRIEKQEVLQEQE